MALNSILTAQGRFNREHFTSRLHKYILDHVSCPEVSKLSWLLAEKDITGPVTMSHTGLIDVMCTALDTHLGSFGVIRLHSEHDEPEGMGRTAFWLRALGMKVNGIDGLSENNTYNGANALDIEGYGSGNVRLVTSDMAFVGECKGRLLLVPPMGEPLVALWDLTRHIYRRVVADYGSGDQRGPRGRLLLQHLLEKIPYAPLETAFGTIGKKYVLSRLVIICVSFGDIGAAVRSRLLSPNEARPLIHEALLNPLFHKSHFWHRNENAHRNKVNALCKQLTYPPECFVLHARVRNGRFPTNHIVIELLRLMNLS